MRKVSLIAVVLLFCSAFALAQKAELGAGYDYLHVDNKIGGGNNSVPAGFFIDGTYYLLKVIGVTGDFEYHHKDLGGGDNARLLSFHGGPRLKAHIGGLEPFAHVLFGVTNFHLNIAGVGSTSDNAFSMKLGGGVDVKVAPHFALRLGEFNYYLTKFASDTQNNVTVGAGIVIR